MSHDGSFPLTPLQTERLARLRVELALAESRVERCQLVERDADGLLFHHLLQGGRMGRGSLSGLLVCVLAACAKDVGDGHSKPRYSSVAAKLRTYGVGYSYICALDPNESMQCWGSDLWGGVGVPVEPVIGVSTSWGSACALGELGTVQCWGGTRTDPALIGDVPEGPFTGLEVGPGANYAIRDDGSVERWGAGEWSPDIPDDVRLTVLSVGSGAGCGIDTDSELLCWSSPSDSAVSVDDPPETVASWVAVGMNHACSLGADSRLACWGANSVGESDAPEGEYIDVSATQYLSCGVAADGELACWGDDVDGDGLTELPAGPFQTIELSWTNACAQRPDGSLVCWGSDEFGQVTDANAAFAEWWPDHAR
jgi:hypothetical protein